MISIYKIFLEMTGEHPSGLIAPFGIIDPSNKSKRILAKLQNITLLDPDVQKQRISKEVIN